MVAVLGVADHNGWAVCVTVGASRGVPVLVDRRRIELIEPGIPSQPYHHETVKMPRPEAEQLVIRVRGAVARTTRARLTQLRDELQPLHTIAAMALRIPPLEYVPVTVAEAHASYPVMCRADGMMYHEALRTAAGELNIPAVLDPRGEAVARAANLLGVSVDDVEQFLRHAGARLGPPWQKEHRLATAAAITMLAERNLLNPGLP
jgi:hypothetical protein